MKAKAMISERADPGLGEAAQHDVGARERAQAGKLAARDDHREHDGAGNHARRSTTSAAGKRRDQMLVAGVVQRETGRRDQQAANTAEIGGNIGHRIVPGTAEGKSKENRRAAARKDQSSEKGGAV
jgi:hypothetical protein